MVGKMRLEFCCSDINIKVLLAVHIKELLCYVTSTNAYRRNKLAVKAAGRSAV